MSKRGRPIGSKNKAKSGAVIDEKASAEVINNKNKIVIGIDQSYKDTGISISYNCELKSATHCHTDNLPNNTEKRIELKNKLTSVFDKAHSLKNKLNCSVQIIIERIRLQSDGFINIDYIKGIGALNAMIVDLAYQYNFSVYSVDTRAWKSAIVGTSKPQPNPYGIDPKKWPTIIWCIGFGFEKYIIDFNVGKKRKGIIHKNLRAYTYNDNIADSIAISLYGFVDNPLLQAEH